MKLFWLAIGLVMGFQAQAAIHTLERSVRAVNNHQVRTNLLIYKVKNQTFEMNNQNWQRFLGRQAFKTNGLFRRIARIRGANEEFGRYFVRSFPQSLNSTDAVNLLNEMYQDRNIEFAYFEPRVSDAVFSVPTSQQTPVVEQPDIADFESRQFYLNAAPEGVDARMAWTLPGGTGKGIRVIDVETGWDVNHFEFGTIIFSNGKNSVENDHGTAVWGQISAKPDGKGVTGLAYDADFGIAGNGWGDEWSDFENYPNTIASVIEGTVAQMLPGDVLVIEQHAPLVDDYGPIEYFEPVFKILEAATKNGIHCVAAAGNGYSNLDDPKYQEAFALTKRDSGCVLVGAADSPISKQVRQRLDFSNYGSRVDAFAYGADVVTAGYGDLLSGSYQGKSANYTKDFGGTSSATPIVAGAMISVLGIAKAKGTTVNPAQLREALRLTGTNQEGNTSEHIGKLPNILQILEHLKLN